MFYTEKAMTLWAADQANCLISETKKEKNTEFVCFKHIKLKTDGVEVDNTTVGDYT